MFFFDTMALTFITFFQLFFEMNKDEIDRSHCAIILYNQTKEIELMQWTKAPTRLIIFRSIMKGMYSYCHQVLFRNFQFLLDKSGL